MVRKQADGRREWVHERAAFRTTEGLLGFLWAVNEAPPKPRVTGRGREMNKTVRELTSTPLLSISAASSYSGFIFLQCPHPKRFTSVIRARTVTQMINQKAIFWWCTFKNKVTIDSETQTDSNCDWIWTTARWFFSPGLFSNMRYHRISWLTSFIVFLKRLGGRRQHLHIKCSRDGATVYRDRK